MAITDVRQQWPLLDVSTAPTSEPVDLCDVKSFIQYDEDDQNPLIDSLIVAAREELERATSRAFVTQTVKLYLDYFPNWEIEIRKPPVASITSVEYVDSGGTTQTLAASKYQSDLVSYPARLWPAYNQVWPTDVRWETTNAVTVTFVAGEAVEAVPERVKTAIKLHVKAMFEGCEPGMAYDALVQSLCWSRLV